MSLSAVHYVQLSLTGLVQGAVVGSIMLTAPLSHYLLVAAVISVAVLGPLGLVSQSALTPNPQLAQTASTAAGAAPAVKP